MNQGLFDNDILVKLIDSGLLADAITALNISSSSVLSSLHYQLKPNSTGKFAKYVKTFPQNSQENLINFVVNQANKLSPPIDNDFVEQCIVEYQLDEGETLLLEAALQIQLPLLLTADKRFLKSFANIQWLRKQFSVQLNGRFVCFESILLQLIDEQGFEAILDKVSESKLRISELKNVFGGEHNKTESQARERLNYEINLLSEILGSLLYSHNTP